MQHIIQKNINENYDINTNTLTIKDVKDETIHITFDNFIPEIMNIVIINSSVTIIENYLGNVLSCNFTIEIDENSKLNRFSILVDNNTNLKVSRTINNKGFYESMQIDLNEYNTDSIENVNLLNEEANGSIIDGIYAIRDLQNEYFRHANYNPTEYFAYRSKKYPVQPGQTYEPMSLTYQPMTLKEKGLDNLGDIKYKTKWYPNGATTQAMYLTVMHRPDDNGLDFNFEHQVAAVSRKQLEYLYYYVCKIMFKGIENPDMPVGDIINLI